MKKLMIALAVVACAAVSQAASYGWYYQTMSGFVDGYNAEIGQEDYTGNPLSGATAYLIYYSADFDGSSATVGLSQSALLTALRNGTSFADATDGFVVKTAQTDGTGNFQTEKFTIDHDPANTGSFPLDVYDGLSAYTAVLVDDNIYLGMEMSTTFDETDGATIYAMEGFSGMAYDKDGTVAFEAGNYGWYSTASSIPEPTSGLLLLLGVAGLALRRRRA